MNQGRAKHGTDVIWFKAFLSILYKPTEVSAQLMVRSCYFLTACWDTHEPDNTPILYPYLIYTDNHAGLQSLVTTESLVASTVVRFALALDRDFRSCAMRLLSGRALMAGCSRFVRAIPMQARNSHCCLGLTERQWADTVNAWGCAEPLTFQQDSNLNWLNKQVP